MRILLLFLFSTILSVAYDSQLEGPGLDVNLITEHRSVSEGKPFTVGLHIHHHPGFHTYWKNPGVVGLATSLKWTLPEGFTASEIQWPHPERTHMIDYPCHGYERDVTLLVTITPPKKLVQKEVTLKVEAGWMCCARGCFPGYQNFSMNLPVTDKPIIDPTSRMLIAKTQKELPKRNSDWKFSASGKDEISLKIIPPKPIAPKDVYFFSSDGQVSSDQPQILAKEADGSFILKLKRSEFSPKNLQKLPGVLQIDDLYFPVTP